MKKTWLAILLAILPATKAKADFFVDSWVLSSVCANPFGSQTAFYTQVQNPFNPPSLQVSVHNSAAAASFAFNWGLATGQFTINANLASEGGNGGPFCGTDNKIKFHITEHTLLSIDSEWTYHFNGGIRWSEIRFWVRNEDTGGNVLIRGDVGDTAAGDPPTDTFHVMDSILLAPGNYSVRSYMDINALGGSPNSISTAHGFANIQMTTVPSPAALGPLAFAAFLIHKRGRR